MDADAIDDRATTVVLDLLDATDDLTPTEFRKVWMLVRDTIDVTVRGNQALGLDAYCPNAE